MFGCLLEVFFSDEKQNDVDLGSRRVGVGSWEEWREVKMYYMREFFQ